MQTKSRHDALLRSMRRNGATTVASLAAEVGTSRRTILRDIGALREEGFLIDTEAGRGGGVRLDPRAASRSPRVSVAEVFALIIIVTAARMSRALPFAGLADRGLAKIERDMSPDAVRDLRRLLDALHFGTLSPQQNLDDLGQADPALLDAFETGFLERRYLRFSYRDGQGHQSEREVEPQAMLVLQPLWYVVAWDPAREGFRHFRMDRMSGPKIISSRQFKRKHPPFANDVCPYREAAA